MRILLIAEHDNQSLKPEFFKCLSAAGELNDCIDVLVIGYQCEDVVRQAAKLSQVSRVLLVDHSQYKHQPEDYLSMLVKDLADDYTHILCSSSSFGKSLMPRVAAFLNVAQISNISSIISADTFIRPIYAGRLLSKVKSNDPVKIITVMASAFQAIGEDSGGSIDLSKIIRLSNKEYKISNPVMYVDETRSPSKRQSLQSAAIVVAAGRGLATAENYQQLESIADKLDAAIGATRAVVDAGWMTNDKQIGQTAKTVAPQLYIAMGVSGAAQHIAGMKDSKVIIAVNKDPDAPIFQVANYALVSDLNEVLPELNSLLSHD